MVKQSTKYLYSVFITAMVLIPFLFNGAVASGEGAEAGNTAYLYSASIESSPAPQDGSIMDSKKIRIINLGPVINHAGVDYAPTVSADGKTLYYVSEKPGSIKNDKDNNSHDFWLSKKADRLDTVFNQPTNLDPSNASGLNGVNTVLNEGAASIAADKTSLYFTGCDRPDGLGNCDIYRTSIEGDKWGRPVNLGRNVNSLNFDSQPAISPDQSRIYFVSTRKGPNSDGEDVKENFDIWYSDYDFDLEEWKPAQNLTAINTSGRDVSPFIAADGVTLFFASDGHSPNFGGQDFYVTRFDPSSKSWSTPENLGEPINTGDDEQFITLPASGDIIYFSSKRTDLPGSQGSLDVFMAFVPSFFQAVNIVGTVVDECSGEFIPAKISIKNPITGKVTTSEITNEKPEFERIVTNDDYGDPKDSVKYINFEITAENPKYGQSRIVQRVEKPEKTNNQEEAGKIATEFKVKIPLGQRPVIAPNVADGDYVKANRAKDPKLANFNGLVMEEILSWDLYPLLNYVFFDEGSSEIPARYLLFDDSNYTAQFNDTTIAGGTLDKYYHVLNIYGYRLTQNPKVNIKLIGCNDNVTQKEKGNLELSKARVTNVYNYLRDVWRIAPERMKIETVNFPNHKSNPQDSLGIQENRRVELIVDEWEVIKPVFEKDPKIQPQPALMNWTLKNGIEDDLVASRRVVIKRGGQPWKTLSVGKTETSWEWDWKDEKAKYPKDEEKYEAQLIVTTNSGAECISDPVEIPVLQVSSEKKKVITGADTLFENYSLILFKFNSFDPGPLNDRIMNDYVYSRCQPTSVIDITGHTDIVGLYETNKKLSENRAKTVYTGINKKTGGKYAELETRGVGEDEPLYPNEVPEGRFYNRTVQVLIKTPVKQDNP